MALFAQVGRKRCDIQPEMRRRTNDAEESIEISGLVQIAVRIELVRIADVLVRTGSRQNGNGNHAKLRVQFDFPQHFPRIRFWKIEIEKNETWNRDVRIVP